MNGVRKHVPEETVSSELSRSLCNESESKMDMEHEGYIGYGSEGYTVVNQHGHEVVTLRAGDTLELFIGTGWQRVQVESGGYKGWYYVMTDGQPARFAL